MVTETPVQRRLRYRDVWWYATSPTHGREIYPRNWRGYRLIVRHLWWATPWAWIIAAAHAIGIIVWLVTR